MLFFFFDFDALSPCAKDEDDILVLVLPYTDMLKMLQTLFQTLEADTFGGK